MFRKRALRQLLEARVNEARDPVAGRLRFVDEVWATLGLMEEVKDSNGNTTDFIESLDEHGRPTLAKGRAMPEEFSLRTLAEAIGGEYFVEEYMNPNSGPDRRTLLEAGPGIDPTAALNINTFSLAVGGLVEAKVLEKYLNPTFIGDQLVTVQPTTKNGEKMIRTSAIGNKAQSRKPGQPHPRAGFDEEWIETPVLDEKALAVEVQQEHTFYDLTGQVLDSAGGVGQELGYLRERTIADLVLGVTNPYNYKGTAYNTYLTSGNHTNSHTNDMVDHTDIDNSIQLLNKMTDPITGKEILVQANTILHHPARTMDFHRVLRASQLRETTATNTVTVSPPIPGLSAFNTLSSQIWANRCTDSDGLNLSEANAKVRWYHGDFRAAFMWMEAWPLRTRQASPTEYVMLDRGLIAAYFANYRGIGAVKEPRYVVENTH